MIADTICDHPGDKDIIPNVHHIFWTKKQALKVEWITPKPEKKSRLK